MPSFTNQQGPPTADASSVEGRSVGVLAVAVLVVAMPDGPVRRIRLQQRVSQVTE